MNKKIRQPLHLTMHTRHGEKSRIKIKKKTELMMKFIILCTGLLMTACSTGVEGIDQTNAPWPGEQSSFHSFVQHNFEIEGIACKVVIPNQVAAGNPWIWRARFWGHQPQTDIALLEKGFHVVYADVAGLFGSPDAVRRWDLFYDVLTQSHGFDKKAVLEGMSRGGLIVFNWASRNPEKVHCIYADAPVCDIKSWPGGKAGAEKQWQQCLDAYGLNEETARIFKGNPVDNLEPLAKAGVPILVVVGDADDVVPVAENTAWVEKRYRELGGEITVIHKPGVGHHPHSLQDPKPIVDFIMQHVFQ
jgi:pimeloyl-ACP methyl ester carboxylesterase